MTDHSETTGDQLPAGTCAGRNLLDASGAFSDPDPVWPRGWWIGPLIALGVPIWVLLFWLIFS